MLLPSGNTFTIIAGRFRLPRSVYAEFCRTGTRIIAAVFIFLWSGAANSLVFANDAARQREDDLFIRNLTERGLHGLAEHHCREMRNRAPTADAKAEWQIRLAAVYEQHAWFADATSRQELLNQCVDELNEFLTKNPVSPESELRLRFQQVRTIRTSVRVAFVITEAGHLSAAGRNAFLSGTDRPIDPTEHFENVQNGIELIEKSLQQLENIRSELPAGAVRNLREEARLLLAELYLLKSRFHEKEGQQHIRESRDKASELLNLIMRSAGTPGTKYSARWFLAELFLLSDSGDEFEAQIRLLQSVRRTAEQPLPEFLMVRHVLKQQEAERARQLLQDADAGTALQRQQTEWLRLESLLVLRQLAEQLDDPQLIAETSQQFVSTSQQTQGLTSGVFGDAINLVIRRFELVEAVGVSVADLIEQVDLRRSQGKTEEALQLIEFTLQQLPPEGPDHSRAALLLHAGEVLIDLRRWEAAHQKLAEAAKLFGTSQRPSEQATADLLRIFAMAQLLASKNAAISRQQYTDALEQHLSRFTDEPTVRTARQWLLRIIENDRPSDAVTLLQSMLSEEEDVRAKTQLLEHTGRLLTSCPETEQSRQQADAFRNSVRVLAENNNALGPAFAVVAFYALELELRSAHDTDWEQKRKQLDKLNADLALMDKPLPKAKNIRQRLALLNTVATARTRQNVSRESQRQAVLQLPPEQHATAVEFLYSHYADEKPVAGNQWLAQISDALLRQLVQRPASPARLSRWLRIASRNTALTGNADVRNQILANVSRLQLSPEELQNFAESLADSPSVSSGSRASSDKASITAQMNFWRQVLATSAQGTDSWLEASLRLAGFSAAIGETAAARRHIGVVETLYPNWGSEERQRRAKKLTATLKP